MSTNFTIRSYQRFPLHCRIYYRGRDGVGHGRVWNLSRTGWRVDGDRGVIPGDHLILCVYLPPRRGLVFVDRAVVRWSRGKEFGLENVHVEEDNETHLSQVVARLVQQPYHRPS